MKKFLIFSAALVAATTVFADESEFTDLTPKAYDFAHATELPKFIMATDGGGNFNINAGSWNTFYKQEYDNGLIVFKGGQYTTKYADVKAGVQLVDLGGTVGKVFAYNRGDADVNADLAKAGCDVNLSMSTTALNYIFSWFSDPETPEVVNAPSDKTSLQGASNRIRVSMEINVHSNEENITAGSANGIMKAYMRNDQGSIVPQGDDGVAASKIVTRGEFTKRWDEVAKDGRVHEADLDEAEENLSGKNEWNPNRWLVYEFDTYLTAGSEKVESYGPLYVKMELPNSANNYTLFIRNIKFYLLPDSEVSPEGNPRSRVWKYYEVGKSAGVDGVAADARLEYKLDGNSVTFADGAVIYAANGAQIAVASPAQAVTLAKGFYIAASNGKAVKFVVR